jgi:hypothetical protein
VKELQADLTELSELMNQFDPLFSESIDPGEQEALALMLAGRCPEHRFCSADARPLQALAMLDMSDRGIALEELLDKMGQSKRLDEQYTKAYLDRQIREGRGDVSKVTGCRGSRDSTSEEFRYGIAVQFLVVHLRRNWIKDPLTTPVECRVYA